MSLLVLAVDTTQEFGSLAIARDGVIVEEVELRAPTGFAHILYAALAGLLDRHALKPADIDCFAAASGPGSFTGVRVGLACVKGLADALGKRAAAVSNLQALATFGTAQNRAVILDARRGEVYGAVYDSAGQLVSPEVVAPLPKWLASLPDGPLEFITQAFPVDLDGTRFQGSPITTTPRTLAAAVAKLAHPADPAALDANYVRRSDAELFWKE